VTCANVKAVFLEGHVASVPNANLHVCTRTCSTTRVRVECFLDPLGEVLRLRGTTVPNPDVSCYKDEDGMRNTEFCMVCDFYLDPHDFAKCGVEIRNVVDSIEKRHLGACGVDLS
jgi:hypothetical protein